MSQTYPYISSARRQLSHNPCCKFAAELRQFLMLFDLAVVVRLPALPRHHLLLDGDHHNVQKTRYHVQKVPFRVIRFRFRWIWWL